MSDGWIDWCFTVVVVVVREFFFFLVLSPVVVFLKYTKTAIFLDFFSDFSQIFLGFFHNTTRYNTVRICFTRRVSECERCVRVFVGSRLGLVASGNTFCDLLLPWPRI